MRSQMELTGSMQERKSRHWRAPGLLLLAMLVMLTLAVTWALTSATALQAAFPDLRPPTEGQPGHSLKPMAQAAIAITTRANDQEDPAIAYNSQADEYLVVWEDYVPPWTPPYTARSDIYARRVRSDGILIGSEFGIATSGNREISPTVAYNPAAEEYLVVWEYEYSSDDHDIYARRVGSDGTLIGDEMLIATLPNFESNPAVAYNSDDDEYLVVWERREGSGEASHCDIYGQRLKSNGSLLGGPIAIGTGLLDQLAPAVAYGSVNGQYLVVWQDETWQTGSKAASTSTTFRFDIYGQRVGSSGSLVGSQIAISTWDYDQVKPCLAFNSQANEFLVVWEHHYSSEDYDVYARRIGSDGTPIGYEFSIVASEDSESSPAVAYKPAANEYLVVWEYEYSSEDHDVYRRRVGSDGTMPEDKKVVSNLSSWEGRPALAADGRWGYLVVWEDSRNVETQGVDLYGKLVVLEFASSAIDLVNARWDGLGPVLEGQTINAGGAVAVLEEGKIQAALAPVTDTISEEEFEANLCHGVIPGALFVEEPLTVLDSSGYTVGTIAPGDYAVKLRSCAEQKVYLPLVLRSGGIALEANRKHAIADMGNTEVKSYLVKSNGEEIEVEPAIFQATSGSADPPFCTVETGSIRLCFRIDRRRFCIRIR